MNRSYLFVRLHVPSVFSRPATAGAWVGHREWEQQAFPEPGAVSGVGQAKGRPRSKPHWDCLGRPVGVVAGLGSGLG